MKKTQQELREVSLSSENSFIEGGNKIVTHPCWKHLKKNFGK